MAVNQAQIQAINLTEIDPNAITAANLREVVQNDDKFKFLCEQIEDDGQLSPIVIRKLREDESTDPNAKYGIIDGHHRFFALKLLQCETVNALEIVTEDELNDLYNAASYNLNHKELESWEKGKILVTLEEKCPDEKLEDIAAKYFAIARSTAFKYKKAYYQHINPDKAKKSNKIKATYNYEELTEYVKDLNNEPSSLEDCKNRLNDVTYIVALLTDYKKQLNKTVKDLKTKVEQSDDNIVEVEYNSELEYVD